MGETRPRLIVFAREPRIGRGKRRLAAGIGDVAAWTAYRRLLNRTLRRLGRDPRWRLEIWLAEPGRLALGSARGCPVRVQGRGDLGARMGEALGMGGPGPALLIGSDIAGVTRADIAKALRLLKGADAVLGPAGDGGYWLVGFGGPAWRRRRLAGQAFTDVRWSSEHALADTLRGLAGARTAFAAERRDVDTAADLAGAGL